MRTVEYVNLTNGLLCPHVRPGMRFLRIQSTWCEQKRWADVLWTVGPDLLMELASGSRCVVHDRSERPRETRACWQGLSWLRYATTRVWYDVEVPEVSRSGMSVTGYWRRQFDALPDRVVTFVDYFRRYATGGPVRLESCYGFGVCITKSGASPSGVEVRLPAGGPGLPARAG